jgi:hypothetical protein
MTTTESTAQAGRPVVPPIRPIGTRIVSRSTVENACEVAHVDIDSITNSYSGPVMHGATCFAVTVDRERLVPFLLALGTAMCTEAAGRDRSCPDEPASDLAEATCTDSTDPQMTVYFPGWSLSTR